MREMIQEIRILDESGKSLFDLGDEYIVPLYQRAYAWEEKEIVQMLHDILDMKEQPDAKYYLGTLIVSHREGKYEVIDGQQRLTTLFLLLKCLEERGDVPRGNANIQQFHTTIRATNYKVRSLLYDVKCKKQIKNGILYLREYINVYWSCLKLFYLAINADVYEQRINEVMRTSSSYVEEARAWLECFDCG